MNFHDKGGADGREAGWSVAYRPAPRDMHASASARSPIFARLGAPIFGSRLVFPRRFDRAVAQLLDDATATNVPSEHAVWYFGASLQLEVDPASLTRRLSDYVVDHRGTRWTGTSFLDAADWSAALSPIDRSPIHREMCELVAAGSDYRDTRAYRNLVYAIELGRPGSRNGVPITSAKEVEAYFDYCRDLIESARMRGVVRRRVSGAFHRLRVKHRKVRSPAFDSRERDIGVAITADGEIVRHLGGKHRTAIAQALKLPWLPVEIRLVHARWIAEQMKRTGRPAHSALKRGVRELRTVATGTAGHPAS